MLFKNQIIRARKDQILINSQMGLIFSVTRKSNGTKKNSSPHLDAPAPEGHTDSSEHKKRVGGQ
jgi:hypothetical protein